MQPKFDLDKIKFATDAPTFERAVGIYESGGIKNFDEDDFGFSADVRGSAGNFYKVYVSAKHYDAGNCNCYLGRNDTLCKHMVAVALYAVKRGEKLTEEDKKSVSAPQCSGRLGEPGKAELKEIKAEITAAMRYIKPYTGPSRIWFSYQDSLSEGCGRLSKIVSGLPVGEGTAQLLVDMLLRLDKKLSVGGVDDSDGTVGSFMEGVVSVLQEYAKLDTNCVRAFKSLEGKETCFGWEEPLLKISLGLDR